MPENKNPQSTKVIKTQKIDPIETPPDTQFDDSLVQRNVHDAIHFKPLPGKIELNSESHEETEIQLDLAKSDTSSILETPALTGVSLKDFETQRRLVEEQNRQKKDILCKAIEQQYVNLICKN